MAQNVAPQAEAPSTKVRKMKPAKRETAKRAKPMKVLPTDRIAFPKQLDLLRAYAAASGPTGKAVTNAEVGSIVKMMDTTVSIANAFFADVGLLTRADGGHLPAAEVVSFQRAFEWNPDGASQKLGPLIAETWFAKALLPKLSFHAMEEAEAIQTLAEAAGAGPDYERQLRICLDYIVAGGLAQRDGTLLKLVRNGAPASERLTGTGTGEPKDPVPSKAAVATAFAQPTEGVVQFHVSVKVDMAEFAGWQPERISSFFSGIAAVLAAKGAIEKDAAR
jgi:hypothetical protein